MAYFVQGDLDRWLRNFQDGMREMIPVLNEWNRNAEPKSLRQLRHVSSGSVDYIEQPDEPREDDRCKD